MKHWLKNIKKQERDARYRARDDYRRDCLNNPYPRGSWQRLCYTDEAQKIFFEREASL